MQDQLRRSTGIILTAVLLMLALAGCDAPLLSELLARLRCPRFKLHPMQTTVCSSSAQTAISTPSTRTAAIAFR